MPKVFLSYASQDHFFAELATIKLAEAGIHVWRDRGQLRAGTEWRKGIEDGIAESDAVLIALSENSAQSAYVTFEWAYALGLGKPLVPIRLGPCSVHPRLEPIQYLDFSNAGALPWSPLIEQIQEIEPPAVDERNTPSDQKNPELEFAQVPYIGSILDYLNQRGYQMASFERLRKRVDENLTDEKLRQIVKENPTLFRSVVLADGKLGLAFARP